MLAPANHRWGNRITTDSSDSRSCRTGSKLKKAADRLQGLRTPEGEPIPPNTVSELRRDMQRRRLLMDQIRQIEDARTENARGTRKTMIVALARKLLISLWHLVRDGVVPEGVVLRPAQ